MLLSCVRWFEEVVTNKDNVEIDILKPCTNCRVYETDSCAEEILNLVFGKDFPLKYLLYYTKNEVFH